MTVKPLALHPPLLLPRLPSSYARRCKTSIEEFQAAVSHTQRIDRKRRLDGLIGEVYLPSPLRVSSLVGSRERERKGRTPQFSAMSQVGF